MTREEKLNKAAFDYVNQGGTTAEWSDGWEDFSDAEYVEESFKSGAEWGHKMSVDKACEWLRNNIDFYVETNYGEDFRVDIEQLLKDIRKAMEE